MPYMRGPAYFDSDLALFKNFKITENQKIQFRLQATNFLNHPLKQFGLASSITALNFDTANTIWTTRPDIDYDHVAFAHQHQHHDHRHSARARGSRSLLISAKYYF